MAFDFNEVRDAYERIRPYVRRTLLEESFYLGDGERRYFFKLESLQRAKSFKIRGALNKMLTLTAEEAARGVGTVSSGNHGSSVSYAASLLGIENAVVIVPAGTPQSKIDRIRCFGAEVLLMGSSYDEAHRLGLRVLIDGVFNHIGWRHPFFQDVLKRGKASPYWSWFYDLPEQPRYPDAGEIPEYACFSYVPQMPKTDTSCPEMRDYFCKVGAYWVREFDVDGWRLDVANEMDDGFLRAFREAVKREKPDALVIGEVWENAAHFVNHGMMDGAMNYDFRRFCRQFFAEGSIDAAEFDLRLSSLLTRYPRQMLSAQLNLLDSHDVSRFLTLCGGDRARMEQAVLFQMSFPGMPCVFYGDEKGLEGASENEYRRPMDFGRPNGLEEAYRRMIALRKEHPALRHGDFQTVLAQGTLFLCRRIAAEESLLLCWNAGGEALPVPGLPKDALPLLQKGWKGGLLEGRGYAVFQIEKS